MTGDRVVSGKQRWRIGFYVEVEVDAYEGEAHIIAEAACGWPGSRSPSHEPVEVEGPFDGGRLQVKARIVRSQTLMLKPIGMPAPRAEHGAQQGTFTPVLPGYAEEVARRRAVSTGEDPTEADQ